jgi:hypothetical protein
MTTVADDLRALIGKMKNFISFLRSSITRIGGIFKRPEKIVAAVVEKETGVGFIGKLINMMHPRARLTYWLADEEVIVYVSDFEQKDKFKLVYKELDTGRTVMVNSANPINYRLEELKPNEKIEKTEIQQNQHY